MNRHLGRLCALILTLVSWAPPQAAGLRELWTYGIVGDAGWPESATRGLRDSLARSRITSLILPGDNLYDPVLRYEDVWDPWRHEGFRFPIVALGNHTAGYEAESRYFEMPGEYFARFEGPALFLVLNSDNESTVEKQASWLREWLRKSRSLFTFVVFHHPPVTISERHGWQEKAEFHRRIRPILREHSSRITALIVGHDHIAGLYSLSGMPMIVSGAGVEAFEASVSSSSEDGLDHDTIWIYDGRPSWLRLDVNARTREAWINFVDVQKDRVTCSALISQRPPLLRENCRQR